MAIDSLKQLDERIQASVARIHQLRQENEKLVQQLAESEGRFLEASEELKQLHSECQQHEDERNEVRSRIEKILTRFDGLELG
ncbi:MAG: cell division protein ZapB [Candidatus Binataceae bacterium]|nr:cell division protein ZapB [Candidatus Binataceae bacterium]